MGGEGEDGGSGMGGEWTNLNRDGVDGEFKPHRLRLIWTLDSSIRK